MSTLSPIKSVKQGAAIDPSAIIKADILDIKSGAKVGKNVVIDAHEVMIGHDSIIDDNTVIKGMESDRMERLVIGDNSYIGQQCDIACKSLEIRDYVTIHKRLSLYGKNSCTIGYNCWIGQDSILNCDERLTIRNNVLIGARTHIWTHISMGELLEGCELHSFQPVTLADDVWLVGGLITISSGITLKKRTIVFPGSAVTKSTEAGHTYSGVPATDITDKIQGYREISTVRKFEMMKQFVNDFLVQNKKKFQRTADGFEVDGCPILFIDNIDDTYLNELNSYAIVITQSCSLVDKSAKATIFDVGNKTYLKRRSQLEVELIKFLNTFRARFVPMYE